MRKLIVLLGLFFWVININAQEYFQQEVNYTIKVELNDKANELYAYESIQYTNNSPDNLDFIYFHLWPNAYKNNSTALAKQKIYSKGKHILFENKKQQGYIDSLNFKVNGEKVNIVYDNENIDICKIILNKGLKSNETITITTPFHVKLPKGTISRLGHLKQSYKITQWYPKPAVYDKNGWHAMPYLDIGEFYSEYGSFDVSITLPKNYVVGATGNLVTESEKKWMQQKAFETAQKENWSDSIIKTPKSSKELKTIRFTENNVHDFAWFADKRYNVQKDTVILPHSGRKVNTWALYPDNERKLWNKSNEYINDALYYYSLWYGDYAYNNCTAIFGRRGSVGNGMEYPTITAIGHSSNAFMLEMVIMHEVGHNWFYGMLGFNERRYPWMDEGINTFSEMRYFATKYPDTNRLHNMITENKKLAKFLGIEKFPYKQMQKIEYLISASLNIDQSASLTSTDYTSMNYAFITYAKAGRVMHHLHKYLGEKKFNKIMQKFFAEWQFKHPYPEDIKKAFEENTKENFDWLFTDLLTTTKKIDYKIKRKKENLILVKNKGDINSPLSISGVKNDKTVFTKWYAGFENTKWLEIPEKETDIIAINKKDYTLDLYN
ncbi:MAG: M1 family metallopeptidase, partial [Bacteroidota bacterium]|nr:M1 family metallopeptidase [Bacteroidota bacterium]